jgi:hypothetical protein
MKTFYLFGYLPIPLRDQGDQIGRNIFTPWASVYFGQFLEYCRSRPIFLNGKGCALILAKYALGFILGDYFTNSSGQPGRDSISRPITPRAETIPLHTKTTPLGKNRSFIKYFRPWQDMISRPIFRYQTPQVTTRPRRRGFCIEVQLASLFSNFPNGGFPARSLFKMAARVARWFVFKPKIQIWVNFGGSCNGRCWYILCTLGPFYGLFYILWTFSIVRDNLAYFSPFWYFVPRKIWQP